MAFNFRETSWLKMTPRFLTVLVEAKVWHSKASVWFNAVSLIFKAPRTALV